MVLGFVAVKYIFKQLGEDVLGIIYFTLMMNALASAVLNMGICSTTVREISAHFETERGYVTDLIRTFSLFFWAIYFSLGLGIYFLSPMLVEKWINLKTIDTQTAIYILRILGIASLVALPKSLYVSLFQGMQRMEVNNLIDVVTTGLQQFGTILVLILGGGLFQVVYWFAFCYALRILSYLAISAHFFSVRALIPGYFQYVVKRNWGFASRMLSISVFASAHMNVDKIIISKLLPIGEVGYYGLAYNGVSKAALFTRAISKAAFPSFSALFRAGDRKKMTTQYQKLQDLVCFGLVPIFAAIPFAILPLFSNIFNEDIARQLLLPTTLLCVGFFMNGTLHIPYVFSLAVGKPGISARQNLYALFIVLPVTAILIYLFGLTGAGLSWVVYHLFAYSYGVPRICTECLQLPVWKWYLHVGKCFTVAAIVYGTGWTVLTSEGHHNLSMLGSAYFTATAVFLTCAYFMIGTELRVMISQILHRIKIKFALNLK